MVACGIENGGASLKGEEQKPPCFDNPADEATYWKRVALGYKQDLQDVKEEFEEFQIGSRELEAELETQLQQYENQVTDLGNSKCKLEDENEKLKEKLDIVDRTSSSQVQNLIDENVKVKSIHDEMLKYIRELEQKNDDLERAKRATISSLESFDVRLNNALERNAFLETELEDKEQLMITIQRLKDESRDLKNEMRRNSLTKDNSLNESKMRYEETSNQNVFDKNKECPSKGSALSENVSNIDETVKCRSESISSVSTSPVADSTTLTPSARISALNIVSDLLRKVGALESKLANCRTFVEKHPPEGAQYTTDALLGLNELTDVNGLLNESSRVEPGRRISGLVKVNV